MSKANKMNFNNPDFLYHFCINENGNYTSNSVYQSNLNAALSSISSITNSTIYGFNNTSVGQNADMANVLALCRGDVEPNTCGQCVYNSTLKLRQICPNQKEAIGWYDFCMLWFSNRSIFQNMADFPGFSMAMSNPTNVTSLSQFNQDLMTLMDSLRSRAAGGGPLRKFAMGNCIPNLSEDDCYKCLDRAASGILGCCGGRRGGRVVTPSCSVRFGVDPFLSETSADATPPTASPPLPAVSPPPLAEDDISTAESLEYEFGTIRTATGNFSETNKHGQGGFGEPNLGSTQQLQEAAIVGEKAINKSLSATKLRHFSLPGILSATHNFDDSKVIGRGGFGKVYKGVLDNGAITVAIKRLNHTSKQGAIEFLTEIEMLSKCQHFNLISLIGYCDDCAEMILVYEYMNGGTLADHLFKIERSDNNSALSWVQRLNICIDAARGLEYLHTGTNVIHRDLKSSNILLDKNLMAKVSDFGMSKVGPTNKSCSHISTKIKGTRGYLDPEYLLTNKLTMKSDVYSFGVVLFEVLSGRPVIDLTRPEEQWGLVFWAQHCIKEETINKIVDSRMSCRILPNSLATFVKIANRCLHYRSKKRPTMAEVVAKLEYALQLQERTDSSILDRDMLSMGLNFGNSSEHEVITCTVSNNST
ncbi:hypothetical protein LguiB_005108 [Lonicera macranthoides]